ncbi:MAG TPA: response regulator transcription factor [Longimicrobiales bacterium]
MPDPARILVVEDEPDVAGLVAYSLASAGYRVETAGDGVVAASAISRERPDLIVLDLMLPGRSGFEILSDLRSAPRPETAVPVVVLSARRDEADRVEGLERGADDYVTKPFSPRELVLRVAAVLRRAKAPPLEETGRLLRGGPIRVDTDTREVAVEGRPVPLTPTEYRLLTVLLERSGRAQSRRALLEAAWDVHVAIDTRTVDIHVLRLRRKLGAAGRWIETVRGHGYRFRREGVA